MLEISPDDVASLNDEDLRSLVGQLCEAELHLHGLSASEATWGGNQNAPDGGIDVRVSTEQAVGGFLPRTSIGFQVKKTDFTPALIGPEMRPSGQLRPSIGELIQQRGAYIIVSSGANTSDAALRDRLETMRNAIDAEDPEGLLHLDFYDRSRLATWARNHPGLMLWVRRRIGRGLSGWKPYEAWAVSPEGVADVYLLDEKARLHAGTSDSKGISINDGLKRLRDALREPRGVVRLAGLSGVGKTRLVQALFDARMEGASLEPSLAVYADMNDNPDPQPSGMLHDLVAMRKRAIVVVDNCAPDLHRRLTEICRAADSTVSVITVEYDVQEDEPEGTEVFRLEPSTPELVAELLKRRFPEMSRVDVSTIAEFSGGNARVALALANTLERNETLSGLKDEALFKRLFHQRQAQDNSLLTAAQACALVYSFQGEALSGDGAELPALGVLAGMTPQELFAKVAELKQRDLVQRRSVWRAVLPHAIANRLAVMALKTIPLEVIEGQLTTERLMRSFSRRIGYLHDSPEAVHVVEKWLGKGGLLENVERLNELGVAMFNNIAPVSPAVTLSAIERALSGPNATEFGGERIRRERMAYVLRSLAYDADLFERAVGALLTLYDVEQHDGNSHPVADAIVSLFHVILSGTHATIAQRVRIVDSQLRSSDPARRALGLKLLDAMLQTGHFSSWHSFEFGARPRDFGFWPKSNAEIEQWYLAVLNMALPLASSGSVVAAGVRKELAEALRGLWFVSPVVEERIKEIAQTILSTDYWQEGWIAVRTILAFSDKKDAQAVTRLRVLEAMLRPKNVMEQVRAVVLSQTWGSLDFEDSEEDDDANPMGAHQRANAAAEELGKEVAKDDALLSALLPDLVRGRASRLTVFGKGLAHGAANKKDVWEKLVNALANTPEGERNAGTLGGFLLGTQNDDSALSESLLDAALEHETLAVWFPALQTTVPVTKAGAERLKKSVLLGKAPLWAYQSLGFGRPSDALTGSDLREILNGLASGPKGYALATEILSMRLHRDKGSEGPHPPELLEAGRELLARAQFDNRDSMQDYRLRVIVNACLSGKEGEEAARAICVRFKEGLANYSVYAFHFDQFVEGLFKTQPRIALDVFFGGLARDGEPVVEVDSFDDLSENRKNPLDAVPDSEILSWCAEGGQLRYAKIAEAVSYARVGKDTPPAWSPIALALLQHAPDPLAVLRIFIERFSPRSWSGSRAAIMESRARLLDDLDGHPNSAIKALVVQMKPELQSEIARAREWETKYDRNRDERFE